MLLISLDGKLKESEDEPLYDSVASDDDYATAEQLAIMVCYYFIRIFVLQLVQHYWCKL